MKKILCFVLPLVAATTFNVMSMPAAVTKPSESKPTVNLSQAEKDKLEKVKADLKEIWEKGLAGGQTPQQIMLQMQKYLDARKTVWQKITSSFKKILFWTAISASVMAAAFVFIRYCELQKNDEVLAQQRERLVKAQEANIREQLELDRMSNTYAQKIREIESNEAQLVLGAAREESLARELTQARAQLAAVTQDRDRAKVFGDTIQQTLISMKTHSNKINQELSEWKQLLQSHRQLFPKTWVEVQTPNGPVIRPKGQKLNVEHTVAVMNAKNILVQKLALSRASMLPDNALIETVILSMFEETLGWSSGDREVGLQNAVDLDILPLSASLLPEMNF